MRIIPAISAAVLAATALTAAPAAAGPPSLPDPAKAPGPPQGDEEFSFSAARQFCSTHVLSVDELKAGRTSKPRCFPTKAQARVDVGLPEKLDERVDVPSPKLDGRVSEGSASLGAGTVWAWAEHYDLQGGGAWLMITGGEFCDGSGISLSLGDPWNDRISSTRPLHCGKVKHWQHWDQTGAQQNVIGLGNLTAMNSSLNNQVSSIGYYAG